MIRSLSIAKTGLDAQQAQLDVVANNLANVGTTGFKRSRAVFEDLMYQNLRQSGGQTSDQTRMPSGLQVGTGVRVVATERIHTQGNPTKTENPKDVAINGSGFFHVLMPDGSAAYTRDGSFQTDSAGQLVTASGFPVLPAITLPHQSRKKRKGRRTREESAARVSCCRPTQLMGDAGFEPATPCVSSRCSSQLS